MQIMRNVRKCSLRYILFIQYQGYVMNINRGKAFMVCGMDGCSIALDFFFHSILRFGRNKSNIIYFLLCCKCAANKR